MNFQIKISKYAKEDLKNAYNFYENQLLGLGEKFFNVIIAEIEMLEIYGCLHQKVYGYHRMLSKKFPYAIYYDCDKKNKIIYVIAILDLRQNPNKNKKTLKKRS
jgi:hypothetical protein